MLKQLIEQLPEEQVTLISQDNYYRHISELKKDEEGMVNFDHPDTVDLDRLGNDLNQLLNGNRVTLEEYTFNNPDLVPKMITYYPAPIIIVEGLFVFHNPKVANLIDLKVFVEAHEYIKLARRIVRDQNERAWDLNEILVNYQKYVAPMYRRYIEPLKYECDFIIPNNNQMYKAVNVLVSYAKSILASQ